MKKTHGEAVEEYFNAIAKARDKWRNKNFYYHNQLEHLYRFLIPPGKKVLEVGCGTGGLLSAVRPSFGVGIDIAENMVKIAKKKYPKLHFSKASAENIQIAERFDYIIVSDLIGNLEDIQKAFQELWKVSDERSRIIVNYYNYLWEPILNLAEKLGLKMPQPTQNWLGKRDIENLLELSNFEVVKSGNLILLPISIPLVSTLLNKYIARLPLFQHLCLVQYFVVRQKPNIYSDREYSVSVIIPARNEAGNIEQAILRTPTFGRNIEFIFVEGHSKDNTREEIKRVMKKYRGSKNIILINQGKGIGKADAVRKGMAKASGEMFLILDADLAVSPEELPKFYHALRLRKGEYIQGTRLVYPMEKQAMRLLNIMGNKFFSLAFTYLLDQPIKDTLCGTKAIFRDDYVAIRKNLYYFGDFDPFGDFELTFGATKLNLKILEIPIRYKARTYGTSNISRFLHGWLLLRMTLIAARKLKFF